MHRAHGILAILGLLAAVGMVNAAEVRRLEVTSIPLSVTPTDMQPESEAPAPHARPASAISLPPFLTLQRAYLGANGVLEVRCEGGSRHNFAAVRRSDDLTSERSQEMIR